MTDELVAALRKEARCRADELNFDDVDAFHEHQLTWIAADRIVELKAEVERLNAILREPRP